MQPDDRIPSDFDGGLSTTAPGPANAELRDYLVIIKRRKVTIAVVAVITLLVALLVSFQQTPIYTASARVVVTPLSTNALEPGSQPEVNMDTEIELLESVPVAERVLEETGADVSTDTLLDEVTAISTTESSEVLQVVYKSADPEFAALMANAFAEQYLDFREGRVREAVNRALLTLERRITVVQNRFTDLSSEMEEARESNNQDLVAVLQAQRTPLFARLGILQQRLDDLEVREIVEVGEVIEPATEPSAPSSPNHLRTGALALVLGLTMGVALAFLRDRLDDRFKGRNDVEHTMQAPVLGTVPSFSTPKKGPPKPALLMSPNSAASEAYRDLRTNVEFVVSQRRSKAIVVTSPASGEGKTATAANLAVALAQAGRRVILLSADLRRPNLEPYFNCPNRLGLSTWLAGSDTPLPAFITKTSVPNVAIMASGPIPPNPAELLASPRLLELLRVLQNECDVLLLDSPPALAVTDAAVLASRVGNTLIVIDSTETHRSAALRTKQALEGVGSEIIGSVINQFDPSDGAYGYAASSTYYTEPAREKSNKDVGRHRHAGRMRSLLRLKG